MWSILFTDRELHHIADYILSFLDAKSLCQAEHVCVGWKRRIADGMLWKKLIEKKTKMNSLWKGLSIRRGWYVLYALMHENMSLLLCVCTIVFICVCVVCICA